MNDKKEAARLERWRAHARKMASALARHPNEELVRGSQVAAWCGFSPFIAKKVGLSEELLTLLSDELRQKGLRVAVAYDARQSAFVIMQEAAP